MEGNVLFNDAFNTFYLQLYGVRHKIKHDSNSERGNTLLLHRLLFLISSKGSFICIIPQRGAGHSSEVERSLMVRWVIRSILHGVDPLSSTTGVTKAVVCVILSVGWCI